MTTPAAEPAAPDVAVASEDPPPVLTELEEKVETKETEEKEEELKDDENPPTTTTDANLSTPTADAAADATPTSAFEHDGTFALPPGTAYTSPVKSPDGSKGATILRNRFSTWRQKANENANTLWKQAKEVQAQAAANHQGPLATLIQVSAVAVANATVTPPVSATVRKKDAATKDKEENDDTEKDPHGHDHANKSFDDEDEEGHHQETDGPFGGRALPNIANIPNIPSRKELRSKAEAVAKEVVGSLDTYATGFRGRYASTLEPIPRPTTFGDAAAAAKESQTALILKSRAAAHLQEILDSLEPYQYVLLLGAGRLQVNLKDPYNKHQGTYVDFLVAGGAADKSGVVAVGDAIVKVGSQDVRKHTIADVPSIIAKAKRPVVLVLTEGVELDVERITYLDLAVAMMHRIRTQEEQQKQAMIASAQKKKQEREEAAENSITDAQEVAVTEDTKAADETQEDDRPATKVEDASTEEEPEIQLPQVVDDKIEIPAIRTIEGYTSPPQPPREARIAYKHLVGKRCNDNFSVTQFSQYAASDDNFRHALRNAFLSCAVDGRRFPFLGRHLTMEQDLVDTNAQSSSSQQPNKNSPNALLMLFLELFNFADFLGVTPVLRRKEVAQRIAYKFFLPTKVNDVGSGQSRLEPPMFDFHHIVADSVLRKLEAALSKADTEGLSQDLFLEFQHAVVDALCGTTFLLFLVSNHAARMRGYLRNVAPYTNFPLKLIMDALTIPATAPNAVVHSGAKTYFLFVLTYLMQLEKDPSSTLSTDDSTLLGRNGKRMVGAAGGLCCCLYIGRVVIPAFREYQTLQETRAVAQSTQSEEGAISSKATTVASVTPTDPNEEAVGEALVKAVGQLWEIFVVPGVGALEHTWKSRETKAYVESLRAKLRSIRKEVLSVGNNGDADKQNTNLFAQKFGFELSLLTNLRDLADHLLYDYAIHTHSQFREHPFHEILCTEAVKAKKEHAKTSTPEGLKGDVANTLPELPSGCIKRLLRKIDLPVGVSPHKPINATGSRKRSAEDDKSSAQSLNAECAVVFGTSVGADLAVKMMSPAMDQSDIRRYTCQDVTGGGERLPESFEDEMIPPTLESYAVLPPTRLSGFAEVTGNVSISADGFEISLVNFMIPKADDGSESEEPHSLYGVSLVFQQSSNARYYPRRISQTQLIRGEATSSEKVEEKKTETAADDQSFEKTTIDDEGKFQSPIAFSTPSGDHWSNIKRNIEVSEDVPKFNNHLREKRWIDRVLQDEMRDQNIPATVGVALVSRWNVCIAMRQTLWMLLKDFSREPGDSNTNKNSITCGSLVDLLGTFAHQDVEGVSLRCILEPYIRAASAPWIERPLSAQKDEFERHAGQQLITCLPPIPLALLFIATLLEQKIVLSSSRRSILFSATAALSGMLAPLKWCHLLVPLVPSALARDLIQYPAPFILGMPSEDPNTMEIMNDLPMDVTLVDLDVGRVILAPELSYDSTAYGDSDEHDARTSMRELRSQILYLAQILGSHFGAKLFRDAWSCDSPSLTLRSVVKSSKQEADYDVLRSVCRSFIDELLAGISSSCFWIDEEPTGDKKNSISEPTVLFDEDRFFHIKRWREQHGYEPLLEHSNVHVNRSLALSMDGFNLVLETFVRCQSVNCFMSSQSKDGMAFSL